MSKLIRISDELHDYLSENADGTPLGKYIESLTGQTAVDVKLDRILRGIHDLEEAVADIRIELDNLVSDEPPAPVEEKKSLATPTGMVKIRIPAIINGEIQQLKAQEAEELEYCQDQDEVNRIHKKYAEKVSILENEINEYWRAKNVE